jgi:hypothetical protein
LYGCDSEGCEGRSAAEARGARRSTDTELAYTYNKPQAGELTFQLDIPINILIQGLIFVIHVILILDQLSIRRVILRIDRYDLALVASMFNSL